MNRIQTRMAFLPLVSSVLKNFEITQNQPMSMLKRKALVELFKTSTFEEQTGGLQITKNFLYEQNTMDTFLTYMFPDMGRDTRAVLEVFNPKYDVDANATNTDIILNPQYAIGVSAGIRNIIKSWSDLETTQKSRPLSSKKYFITQSI